MNSTFFHFFLPISAVAYFLLAFVLRSWLTWRQTGKNPIVFAHGDNAHDYIGRMFKLIMVATLAWLGLYGFWPAGYQFLLPIDSLEIEEVKWAGAGLIVLAFAITLIAQAQMASSWRIGIDPGDKTELIRHGLFRYSRNPIFLGMLLLYLGSFCIAPNGLSFALFLLSYVLIQVQVRLEEDYLERMHGTEYRKYKGLVSRWLGWPKVG